MKHKVRSHAVAALSRLAIFTIALNISLNSSFADPFFEIGEGTGTSWTQAIASGNVVPVTSGAGLTTAAISYYDDRLTADPALDGYALQTSTLIPDTLETDGYSEAHTAMRMEWPVTGNSDPGNDILDIAAWEYQYPDKAPQNLSDSFLQVSILAREGVSDLSVELIDINGKTKGWFKEGPVTESWGTVTFDTDIIGDQNSFKGKRDLGFDIEQVVKIRFDETWRGKVYNYTIAQNAWGKVILTPEPATLVLLALGGLILAKRRT